MSASKTARALLCGVAFCGASCARPRVMPQPHDPPARLTVVAENHVDITTNAWVELQARLATAARTDADVPSELRSAKTAYQRTLAHDDADELLAATLRGLARCGDDACAFGILEPTGFAFSFQQALPWFVAREWDAHAKIAWAGVERVHEVVGPRLTAILEIIGQRLGVTTGPVVVTAESPPSGTNAFLDPTLAASGPCFARTRMLDKALQNARVIDCVAVRAVLAGDAPLRATFGERLWTVVVVHEVAALVTGFEPRHVSVDRRAAAIAAPEMLDFVTAELRPDASGHAAPVTPELARRWRERGAAPSDSASH